MSQDAGQDLKKILASLDERRRALDPNGDEGSGRDSDREHEPGHFPRSATLRFVCDHPGLSAGVGAALVLLGPRRVARWTALVLRTVTL